MAKAGLKIIIETHSDHIINSIRMTVKNKILSSSQVLFNYFYFSEDSSFVNIKPIKIDEYAKLDEWPKGFFDQIDLDLVNLNKLS